MDFIDVSVDLCQDMPVWPNSSGLELYRTLSLDRGDIANESMMTCSVHTGTHIDAPQHFISNGNTVDRLSLETMIGTAFVSDLSDCESITANDLSRIEIPTGVKRLLLKTKNSIFWDEGRTDFYENFVALTSDAAEWVVNRKIDLIGIDYLSIQRYHDGPLTHQLLLNAEIIIVEGLNLSAVEQGPYNLICLPLKLTGAEGAPARVVLQK